MKPKSGRSAAFPARVPIESAGIRELAWDLFSGMSGWVLFRYITKQLDPNAWLGYDDEPPRQLRAVLKVWPARPAWRVDCPQLVGHSKKLGIGAQNCRRVSVRAQLRRSGPHLFRQGTGGVSRPANCG